MTVEIKTSRWDSVGDGVTLDFPYNNRIFEVSDLTVYIDGLKMSHITDYTVSGVDEVDGGDVSFLIAPVAGAEIVVDRQVPAEQPTAYPPGGSFPTKAVEKAQDRLTILIQQLLTSVSRKLGLAVSDAYAGSLDLPTGTDATGKALLMDETGFALGPTADEVSSAQTHATNTAADAVQTAADRVQTGVDAAAAAASAASVITFAFQGAWNADTNIPEIPAAAPENNGHWYLVWVAGTTDIDGETEWKPKDWVVSNGSTWLKLDSSFPLAALLANQAAALAAGFGVVGGTLTDAATVTPDFNDSNAFDWTIGDDRTLAFPTIITGQTKGMMYIDATASGDPRTITLGAGLTEQNNGDGLTIPDGATFRIWIVLRSDTAGHVYTEALL